MHPGKEIEIQYKGLRSEKKLAEKLYSESERESATEHPKLLQIDWVIANSGIFKGDVRKLIHLAGSGDDQQTRALLADLSGRSDRGEIE